MGHGEVVGVGGGVGGAPKGRIGSGEVTGNAPSGGRGVSKGIWRTKERGVRGTGGRLECGREDVVSELCFANSKNTTFK